MCYFDDIFLYIYFGSDHGLLISFMTWIRPVIPSKEKSLCYFEICISISIFDLVLISFIRFKDILYIYLYVFNLSFKLLFICTAKRFCLALGLCVFPWAGRRETQD